MLLNVKVERMILGRFNNYFANIFILWNVIYIMYDINIKNGLLKHIFGTFYALLYICTSEVYVYYAVVKIGFYIIN